MVVDGAEVVVVVEPRRLRIVRRVGVTLEGAAVVVVVVVEALVVSVISASVGEVSSSSSAEFGEFSSDDI